MVDPADVRFPFTGELSPANETNGTFSTRAPPAAAVWLRAPGVRKRVFFVFPN